MALKTKKKPTEVTLEGMAKQFGDSVYKASAVPKVTRANTGVFALDVATGGGYPKGRISIIYGPESSGKSTLCLKAVVEAQTQEPDKFQVWADIENSFDADWAVKVGVNLDKLFMVYASTAEEAIDKIEVAVCAKDVNLLVADSIAMLEPENELESSSEKASVGGNSALVGKMLRKINARLTQLRLKGVFPVVLLINQIRHKIGVLYGDPETMPGGNSIKFNSSLTIRLYGKEVKDEAYKDKWREITFIIKKKRVKIIGRTGGFEMCVTDDAELGWMPGMVNDYPLVISLLKDLNHVKKNGSKGWFLFDEPGFKNLDKVRDKVFEDYEGIKNRLVTEMVGLHYHKEEADTP